MASKHDDDLKDLKSFFQSLPGLIALGVAGLAVIAGLVWSVVTGVL